MIDQVAHNLAQRWGLSPTRGSAHGVDGAEKLAAILRLLDTDTAQEVLTYLIEMNATLASEVQQRLDPDANHQS